MRIVYVVTRADDIGGAQVHVRDLSTALHQAGHDVTVVSGSPGVLSEQLRERGVPFRSLPALVRPIAPLRDAVAVRQLTAELRRLQPDLVSTHSSKAGWIGRVAAKLLRIPVLFTAHGWAFTEGVPGGQRQFYALAERLAAPLADHIITVSEYDRGLALGRRLTRPERITCIHNGVVDLPATSIPQQHQRPVRIAMIGRFTQQKDHGALMRALREHMHLDWVLDLVGDGPGWADAKALASELGVADRVYFLGARDDVSEILSRAHIYTLVSHWEGFPRSILEAMRSGLPVAASDVGGIAEAVLSGKTGFLVPRGDTATLATHLELLIRDERLRRALGSAGRRSYEEKFRFQFMFDRTLAVYEDVIRARRCKVNPGSS